MARLIIELNRVNSNFRSGINFANNPHLAKWLEEYCREKGWVFVLLIEAKSRMKLEMQRVQACRGK